MNLGPKKKFNLNTKLILIPKKNKNKKKPDLFHDKDHYDTTDTFWLS